MASAQKNNYLLNQEHKAAARGYRFIAGIDEAGRGPLAGPVVAASVILKSYYFNVRIDDSKKLSHLARERAYKEISQKAFIGIGIVPEDAIDRINIYQATMLAMRISILDLDVKPDFLLIDGNMNLSIETEQVAIIRGDQKSLSIACASIVAKVTRDRLLKFYNNIFPGYGFSQHKGYGTKSHISAITRKGLSPIHRRSFHLESVIRG
ncbi:MAG: ribonuclease HII [Dehalococcoidia bacterium]|nr:MAG: ribonuclease HII [Dehalococcoidia bacterium]